MKAVVIGGSGHIGTYLVPKLVKAGYKVISISRGQSKPYKEDAAWREVEQMLLDSPIIFSVPLSGHMEGQLLCR